MHTLRHLLDEPCPEAFDMEAQLWEELTSRGRERLRVLLEHAMETELTQRLGYARYARNAQVHSDYRNGYYTRDLDTQFGPIRGLRVPRARQTQRQYQVLARYARRAPWVNALVEEMFVAGVSTRRVGRIVERLLGASVSATSVSRITVSLEAQGRQWHHRPLFDYYRYLLADGVYLKVKGAPGARKLLALCVYGITWEGKRELLEFRLAQSESEREWTLLLEDLQKRGLEGKRLRLVVTDGGQGLLSALQAVFPHVPRQRCWAHKLRNVANQLKTAQQQPCLQQAAGIYQAPSRREAIWRFRRWRTQWTLEAPTAVLCLEKDLEELLTFFTQPAAHWKKIRTTNAIERQFREVRRRTNPMTCFTNEASADRILYAIFTDANARWAESLLKEFTQNS
jgi:putative transposase